MNRRGSEEFIHVSVSLQLRKVNSVLQQRCRAFQLPSALLTLPCQLQEVLPYLTLDLWCCADNCPICSPTSGGVYCNIRGRVELPINGLASIRGLAVCLTGVNEVTVGSYHCPPPRTLSGRFNLFSPRTRIHISQSLLGSLSCCLPARSLRRTLQRQAIRAYFSAKAFKDILALPWPPYESTSRRYPPSTRDDYYLQDWAVPSCYYVPAN